MNVAAQSTLSSPLNALIWVFGVAGGVSIALILTSMALAWRHRKRRNNLLRWSGQDVVEYWNRLLTSGDLVMARQLRVGAVRVARQLRDELKERQARENPVTTEEPNPQNYQQGT